jgi:hypothetical protein
VDFATDLDQLVGVAAVPAFEELGRDVEVQFAAARSARIRAGLLGCVLQEELVLGCLGARRIS